MPEPPLGVALRRAGWWSDALATEVQVSARPEPRERLDPRARTLWRLTGLLAAVPAVLRSALTAWVLTIRGVPGPAAMTPVGIALVLAAMWVLVLPDLLWRHWRYEVGEDEVDLQHGMLTITRTLIPMARVQHVDTDCGPIERRFGLATVVLYTAAGPSKIPGLAGAVADRLRDHIFARVKAGEDL